MGLFSKKKNEKPTGDKACQQGYLSFSPDDVKKQKEASKDNSAAYDLLWQAMTTSSHISKRDKKGNEVPIGDVYPVSLEETLEMERLLNEAEEKIQDHNDEPLNNQIGELRYIIDWSKKRHFNFSWIVILGVILGLFVLNHFRTYPREQAMKWKAMVNKIDNWVEQDTTITWENTQARYYSSVEDFRFKSANVYKAAIVGRQKSSYNYDLNRIDEIKGQLDTVKSKDKKKRLTKEMKSYEENAEGFKKDGEEYSKLEFKELKKMAEQDCKKIYKRYRKEARKYTFWIWVFIIMIPLYIIADRPYGWMETRHRLESKILGGIKKIGYALAAGMFSAGVGMQFLPDVLVKYTYSNGRTETRSEENTDNYFIMMMKILLIIGAIFVAAITSAFLMTYSTVTGLIRNYNWESILATAKSKMHILLLFISIFGITSLYAQNPPIGAINGLFSVNDTTQVCFSQGNLQYQASTNTWRFAEHQWDYIGEDNANISPEYDGWIDLFGWATSGYDHGAVCYQPWSSSEYWGDYSAYGNSHSCINEQTGQADWGYNAISNGGNTENTWRTLSRDEFLYLFWYRNTPSGIRFVSAQVNDINGAILLPDNWDSENFELLNPNNAGPGYINIITEDDWTNYLEANGAIFLPASGKREGTTIFDVGISGSYWSTTIYDIGWSFFLYFNGSGLNPNSSYYRPCGYSVRLVTSSNNYTYSINENPDDMFKVYPNPANDIIVIESSGRIYKFEVYNTSGQLVELISDCTGKKEIDVSSLSKGVYIIRCVIDGKALMRKLIIR